jgi:hypothetical protein
MRHRDPICRPGSLIRRARNRRRQSTGGCLAGYGGNRNPLQSAARAKRPRRMGLCSEVADGGENLEDHPAFATRYVRCNAPFQHANCPANWSRAALNLFHSAQTKSCLGHCITRGIRLRRQATIFRLRGAVLSAGAEARPAPEFGRARGVEIPGAKILPCVCAAKCFQHGIMELCGSTPVLAEECGRFHESQRRRTYADEVANPRGSGSGNFGSATWSGRDRSRHGLRCWPCAASS